MPNPGRRSLLALGLAAAPLAAAAQPAERPIAFIIPFPPGGGTDVMVRAMIPYLEKHLPGSRFVALNRPGAGAEVGYTALALAPADGMTIGVVIVPSLQTITIERSPRYKLEDLAFLGAVVDDPGGFFVAPDSPLKTPADLAAHVRANADRVAVGTAGIGSDDHLLMMGFERLAGGLAGARMVHVPFAGQAPTITALLGRHITVAAMNIGESLELVKQGQVRALAQASPERSGLAPDIPTFREQGFDLVGGVVRGLALPAATPAPVRARLEAALLAVMDDAGWQAEAARLYQPLRRMDAAAFTTLVQAEATELRRLWAERPWKDQ